MFLNDDKSDFALLYSARDMGFSGNKSFLFSDKIAEIKTDNFHDFAAKYQQYQASPICGYIAYEALHSLEKISRAEHEAYIKSPRINFNIYAKMQEFDQHLPQDDCIVQTIWHESKMDKQQYFASVEAIRQKIADGEIYQANLTRKIYGELRLNNTPFALFAKLCRKSPAPYASFLKIRDIYILSLSPERFMHISDGMVNVRPIKGSMPRGASDEEDMRNIEILRSSSKDRAENLMIVDLMRNDLSRFCDISSVRCDELFELATHANVHHLSSSVSGRLRSEMNIIDALKHSFPAGSMTGAPKIRAMEVISSLEGIERGIYSGIIGYINQQQADFSVVIRTLILQDIGGGKYKFEMQNGGGIVYDSDPEKEWQEMMAKASIIAEELRL